MTRHRSETRDAGVTLPELLIGITLTGLLLSAISFALIAVLRQGDNTEGRLNNARSEQAVNLWMPADLASATSVFVEPDKSPCFGTCPSNVAVGGTNAMLLTWTDKVANGAGTAVVTVTTNVSYRYVLVGAEYQLIRFACTSTDGVQACRSNVVLHDLDAPPPGVDYVEGVTPPSWVLTVNKPLAADATSVDGPVAAGAGVKKAQRVTVTVNGGGDVAGSGGGINQINLSAGGANTSQIDASSLQGAPTLVAARSRCGGAIAMVVDTSGSIGATAMGKPIGSATAPNGSGVIGAIQNFVLAFAGTPVKLELVTFSTQSNVLGAGSGWSRYYDMLVESDVSDLNDLVATLVSNGNTNWEDALQRTFFDKSGAVQPVLPSLVVFFTDGVPTYSRINATSATAPTTTPARLTPAGITGYSQIGGGGTNYNQEAFYRANYIAAQFRDSVRMIGVVVGPDAQTNVPWVTNVAGWHYEYTRRYDWSYRRWYHIDQQSGSTWADAPSQSQPRSNGTKRRVNFSATFRNSVAVSITDHADTDLATSWTKPSGNPTNQTLYDQQNNSALGDANSSDGWSRTKTYSSSGSLSEPATVTDYNNNATGVVRTKVFGAPYDSYDTPTTVATPSDKVLGRLIAGSDNNVIPPTLVNGQYTNSAVANLYVLPNWNDFQGALQTIALAECGGTLTLQTKNAGVSAADPFTYQKSGVTDSAGGALTSDQTVVTTSRQFPSGTFDLSIPNGEFVTVEVQPQNLSDLTGYTPGGWSCRAGLADRSFSLVDIPNSNWKGIRVKVAANEAVSCTLAVSR